MRWRTAAFAHAFIIDRSIRIPAWRFAASTAALAPSALMIRSNAPSSALAASAAVAIWTFHTVIPRITIAYLHRLPTNCMIFSPIAFRPALASCSAACNCSINATVSSPVAFLSISLILAASASAAFTADLPARAASPKASAASLAACSPAFAPAWAARQHTMRWRTAAFAHAFIIDRNIFSPDSLLQRCASAVALAIARISALAARCAAPAVSFALAFAMLDLQFVSLFTTVVFCHFSSVELMIRNPEALLKRPKILALVLAS